MTPLFHPTRPDAAHQACFERARQVRLRHRDLARRPRPWWALALPLALAPVALAAIAAIPTAPGWATVPLYLVAGWCLAAMGLIGHDCTHGAVTGSRRADAWLGSFLLTHLFMSFEAYRALHLAHHRWNAYDRDPSADSPRLQAQTDLVTHVLFLLVPLGFPTFQVVPGWLSGFGLAPAGYPRVDRGRVRLQLLGVIAYHSLLVGALPDGAYRAYLGAWVLALVFAMQLLAFNHLFVEMYTDCILCNTRNVRTWPLLGWITLFQGYHVEHHLLPGVPWYRLPEVHRSLEALGGTTYPVDGYLRAQVQVMRRQALRLVERTRENVAWLRARLGLDPPGGPGAVA